jgi:multicomponent Na+:H+ antiporter subunit E
MRTFLFNVLLALLWAAVNGTFTLRTLAAGFLVGYLILFVVRPALGPTSYHGRLWETLGFTLFYVVELFHSSFRVARAALALRLEVDPGVIGLPLDATTDLEITLLANLISLTPGTLSLDVSADRKVLYIHAMDIEGRDVEALRAHLKRSMEQRVLRLLRRTPRPG